MVCILKPYGEVVCSPFEVMHTDIVFVKLIHKLFTICCLFLILLPFSWSLSKNIVYRIQGKLSLS